MSIEGLLDDPETFLPVDDEENAEVRTEEIEPRHACAVNRLPRVEILSKAERNRLIRLARTGDEKARARVILAHIPMAIKLAKLRCRDRAMEDDVLSAALVGVVQGVDRYDPDLSDNSSAYIGAYIGKEVSGQTISERSLVAFKNTPSQRRVLNNLGRAKHKLGIEGQGRMSWGSALRLSEDLGVAADEIQEINARMNLPALEADALERPWIRALNPLIDDHATHLDEIADRDGQRRMEAALRTASRSLSERERDILRSRMLSARPEFLEVLGERHGVTRERIRQLEENILVKLRTAVTAINPDLARDMGWRPETDASDRDDGGIRITKPIGNDGRRGEWIIIRDDAGVEMASYLKDGDGRARAEAYVAGHGFGRDRISLDPGGLAIVAHRDARRYDVVHHEVVFSSHRSEPLARAWIDGLRLGYRSSSRREDTGHVRNRRWRIPLRTPDEERPAWDDGIEDDVVVPPVESMTDEASSGAIRDEADACTKECVEDSIDIEADVFEDIDPDLLEAVLSDDDDADLDPDHVRLDAERVIAADAGCETIPPAARTSEAEAIEPDDRVQPPPRQGARTGRRRSERAVRGFMEWHAARARPGSMGR